MKYKAEYQKDCEGNKTQLRRLRESAVAAKPMSRAVCITHPGVFRPICETVGRNVPAALFAGALLEAH